MTREDTYEIRVTLDGVDLGTWDKMSGGEVDSEETTYRPGGLKDPVALGGGVTTGNVTVQRLNDSTAHSFVHWLIQRSGKATGTVVKQPLDAEGNAFGRPLVYPVRLKAVTPPDVDSEGNGAALLSLEFTVNGRPS